jgi:hypothetical protein
MKSSNNRKFAAVIFGAITLTWGTSNAQGVSLMTRETFQIGAQVSGYRYEEVVNDAPFMSTNGSKLGITASYTGTLQDNAFVSLDTRYATGPVNYDGSGTGTAAEHMTEVRLTGGLDFPKQGYVLSPYSGLGFRSLHNDLAGYTTTGAVGYRRDSTYIYLPLGITHRFATAQGRIATTAEFDYLIQGTQVSHLGDAGSAGDLSNLQRNGRGMRLGVAYETLHWSAGVFYQQWQIERSDDATAVGNGQAVIGYEPKNTTKEFGIDIRYAF